MDNDLMARRLRPPSQPAPARGQQPAQTPSPWDVPIAPDWQFAPPDGELPPADPRFAPPDPEARSDVPWDRPDPEPWPPADDESADSSAQTSSADDGDGPAQPANPEWPATASHSDSDEPLWDLPAPEAALAADESPDPYDAMAPVVSDVVQAPVGVWASWNGTGEDATPIAPEPMTVAAHGDGPIDFDESRAAPWSEAESIPIFSSASSGGGTTGAETVPDWPPEDDLAVAPPTGDGPVVPEDSWPVTPPVAPPTEPPIAAAAEPEPEPAAPIAPELAPAEPTPPEPMTTGSDTPLAATVTMLPGATPPNMVLRIEVAIVDQSHRSNPGEAAKRASPDADVRLSEYEPRSHGRAWMPWPEYLWDAPAEPPAPLVPDQGTLIDWNLPQVGPSEPMADPLPPWSSPASQQPAQRHSAQEPFAPPPTWALTQPAPYQPPAPPQYPPAYQAQQPAWPPAQAVQPRDPLTGLPATQYVAPAQYVSPAPYAPSAPIMANQAQMPAQPVPSAPTADAPATSAGVEGDVQRKVLSLPIWATGLAIGFALLLIVLVLVLLQS